MLATHLCLSTNQLEQDYNGTRIIASYKLHRSDLRVKRGTQEFCRQFNVEPFPSEEEWKTAGEFEGALRETSRLTTICQNEEKLTLACGPVTRKA